ncbi:MAG TPA: helix-turn-helix domain-containing protein [Lactovum miscens]|uniref:helix-turn-helix domain-containing protein n=1 Tax=Lactovum miscens TaxID=190387 RepID=UPI002ED9665B
MVKELGEIFKTIREEKNFSIRKAVGNVLSKSQLSRFERGENDISAKKLFALLENINVPIEDFAERFHEFNIDPSKKLFNTIGYLEQTGDFTELKKLGEKQLNLFYDDFKLINRLNYLAIKGILATHELGKKLTYEEKRIIIDYLYNILEWQQYELHLFNATISQMDYPNVRFLGKEIFHREYFFKDIPENRDLILRGVRNFAIISIRNNDFETTYAILNWLDENRKDESEFKVRVIQKLILIELYEHTGKIQAAIKELSDIVLIYEKFGNTHSYEQYKKELEELRKQVQ